MPYQQLAMEMFNLIENTIVNSQLPSSHEPNLIKKKDFDKLVHDENYQAYDGIIKSKKQEKQEKGRNSGRGDTSLSDQGDSSRQVKEAVAQDELYLSLKDKNNRTNKYIIDDIDFLENA